MILDAHVHIGHWPEFGLTFTLKDLQSVMRKYGYDGAVLTPALTGSPVKANMVLHEQVQRDPRFYFFAWVDGSKDVLRYLETGEDYIRGLKFHPSISQTAIDAPQIRPILELADRKRLPLLYHCGRSPLSWAGPVQRIADSYPNVNFILGHLGGNAYDRIVLTMKLFSTGLPRNVYVESSTARHPDLLSRAIGNYGHDKVMFGSDMPFTDPRMNWSCIRYAGLDQDKGFLGGNLLQLLGGRYVQSEAVDHLVA